MRFPVARSGRFWLGCFAGALFVLRVVYAWALRVNSDEPQHLHVVWAWTRGLLPYRDVFDNHTPLFQLLSAPLFALIGERPEILPLMRLATIPWYALALWCSYRIGRTLFDARTGAWAAVLTALIPSFFILSAQFRTDVGWAPLWLAVIMVTVEGTPTRARAFCVGLLAGAACAVSLKSSLLLAMLAVSSLVVLALQRSLAQRLPWREIARTTAFLLGGFAVVPGAIALGFWLAGAWHAFVYCVFVHNLVPGLGNWQHGEWRFLLFPVALPPLVFVARELLRRDADPERGARRALVWLSATFYVAALMSYWPLVTRQDLLPFRPLAVIFVVAAVRAWRPSPGWRAEMPLRLIAAACLELLLLFSYRTPFKDRIHRYVVELRDVQRLTDAGDYVMDAKGEAIFRRRPFYYALEQITLKRMELGLIDDTIADDLRSTGTAVVLSGHEFERFPAAARAFIDDNYVPVRAGIRVAGKVLAEAPRDTTQTVTIEVPVRYALLDGAGAFDGDLDGTPYREPRLLAPGPHRVTRRGGEGPVTFAWAQAVERGYLPEPAQAPR